MSRARRGSTIRSWPNNALGVGMPPQSREKSPRSQASSPLRADPPTRLRKDAATLLHSRSAQGAHTTPTAHTRLPLPARMTHHRCTSRSCSTLGVLEIQSRDHSTEIRYRRAERDLHPRLHLRRPSRGVQRAQMPSRGLAGRTRLRRGHPPNPGRSLHQAVSLRHLRSASRWLRLHKEERANDGRVMAVSFLAQPCRFPPALVDSRGDNGSDDLLDATRCTRQGSTARVREEHHSSLLD